MQDANAGDDTVQFPDPAADSANAADDIARDVSAVQRIQAVPTLLQVLCDITGMRFAAVVRAGEAGWIACAVQDHLHLGVRPGGPLDVDATLCVESAPITLANGRYFGSLCAMDPEPTKISPLARGTFKQFAALIAAQLDSDLVSESAETLLRDERAASELREQFIAILGHDLRNPLHAIAATSELMIRRANDPVTAGMASRIKANSRRMSSLIDDVLDFARGRLGGGFGLHLTDVENINGAFMSVVAELQDARPGRAIRCNFTVARPVRCDIGRLQQVVSNLIGNALTHGVADTPIRASASADEHQLAFEVWNAGEPIPAENLPKVFEPFWRRDSAIGREGLGLGLHICAQIVRAHGGKVSVSSSRAAGTTFTVRVPLAGAQPIDFPGASGSGN